MTKKNLKAEENPIESWFLKNGPPCHATNKEKKEERGSDVEGDRSAMGGHSFWGRVRKN